MKRRILNALSEIKIALDPESDVDKAWRVHRIYQRLDQDEKLFMKKYEAHIRTSSSSSVPVSLQVPCVFNATKLVRKWKGYDVWTGRKVEEEEVLKRRFRCGETENGEEVLVSMRHMFEYCLCCRDDTPIYIFDRDFSRRYESMLSEYDSKAIPKILGIKTNLLDLHDTEKCPPRRWFLVGPKGSGTDVHTDPRGTCAWNALLRGKKVWVLLDPSFSKDQVGEGSNADDLPSSRWFMGNHLSELIEKYPKKVFVILQQEGDVVFVPPNYYHAVWNLDSLNVAVTENMITTSSFRNDCYKVHNNKSDDEKLCEFVEEYYGLLDAKQTREWLDRVLPLLKK